MLYKRKDIIMESNELLERISKSQDNILDKLEDIDIRIKNIEKKIHFNSSSKRKPLDELTFEELHEIKIEKLNVPSNDVLKALSYGDFRTVLMIFKKVYKNKNDVYPIKIKGPRSFEYFENNRWIPDAYGTHIMECIFKNMEELFLKNNDLDDVGQEIFFRNQLFINKFMTEKYRKSLFKHIIEEVEIHN